MPRNTDFGANAMAARQLNRVLQHLSTILDRQETAGMADTDLVKRYVQERDEAAFEAILRRHGPMVLGVCWRVLRNRQDAEDAFQATFLVLVRKASQLRSPGLVGNWLYGVAYRTALHARNAAARRRVEEAAVVARTEIPEDPCAELRAVLDRAVARLPEKYRAVVVLSDLQGKTRKEIARHLGLPEGTVASRLARARQRLAKWLTRQGISVTSGALAALPQSATAPVPASLLLATANAARLMVAGRAAATGIISAKVLALKEGVLQAMWMTKMKSLIMLSLVLGLGIGTGMVAYPRAGQEQQGPKQARSKPAKGHALAEPEKPTIQEKVSERVDLAGDPLPEGAMARFGTVGFRLGNPVQGLAFGPEGKSLVAADWSGIYVWDSATGKELRRIGGDHETHLGSCSFSADGKRFATCVTERQSGTIHVWEVLSGAQIAQFPAPAWSKVVLSANGTLVASCSQGNIHLWDIARGQELGQWTVQQKVRGG
jgi:RNA polymerase sigma factor (sigma-70 family)